MPQKLRVFISSTMEDLANEREAVVERLKAFNMEPVNAEGLLPTGGTSWNVLEDEIRSSHIFVLILGDSYGWIPKTGYGAGQDKSVTHLETDLARSAKLPILPFFKVLKYSQSDRARTSSGATSSGLRLVTGLEASSGPNSGWPATWQKRCPMRCWTCFSTAT